MRVCATEAGLHDRMAAAPYSFIDVAILDGVRERFAAGDALVILSADLEELIWANGPGALLFGHTDIGAVGGADSGLSQPAKRQIMSTSGYPRIGTDRGLVVRLARGLENHAYAFLASAVALPDGEEAIMLAMPAGNDVADAEIAQSAISGFVEPGIYAAFVDGRGQVEAATPGFEALGIDRSALARLASDADAAGQRPVKRMIRGGAGDLPAGMAQLRAVPPRNLLVVVDESRMWGDDEPAPAPQAVAPQQPATIPSPEPKPAPAPAPQEAVVRPPVQPAIETPPVAEETPDEDDPDWWVGTEPGHGIPPPREPVFRNTSVASDDGADEAAAAPAPDEQDGQDAQDESLAPQVDRAASPLRFVWRTDAAGRLSAISPEFLDAVGAKAADVIGRPYAEIAEALDLDPFGEVKGLLERRDTWSGRSVFWPIAGTDLRVPVDLAALPVYARDRSFEGFRGFGVARMADTVVDPEALGLSLGGPPRQKAPQPEPPHAPADLLPGDLPDDPFGGETPAITIAPRPERRHSDKVVRLAEHRGESSDRGLTPVERTAFREIGERLRGHASEPRRETPKAAAPVVPQAPVTDVSASPEEPSFPSPAPEFMLPPVDAATTAPVEPASSPREPEHPAARQTTAELKIEGVVPSAFAGPSSAPRKPVSVQDTPLLSRLPVPVLVHSGDTLHYANEEFLTLTGYRSVEELSAAGGLGALFEQDYAAEDGEDAAGRALRLRTRDGESFAIDALLRSVPWNGGKALMLVVRRTGDEEEEAPPSRITATAPATAPETADTLSAGEVDELRARVEEMRAIIDTATDGVILITKDGAIRSISRPAEALFGFDSDDVAGKQFASLFAIESQRAARDYLAGLSDNGVASVLNDGREVIGREAQGRFIPLFMTIGRLPDDSGFCAVVRDITSWKRAEEELTQAKAMAERASSQKTDFLARVSHEIRTPLNAIIGFSELMIDERFGPIANDRYRDYLRDINRSGNHVLDLVNDLLDISKIEAGEQEMQYEAVSLNEALAEAVAMMQPQANRERVIIRSSFASRLPDVVADERSVRQIALNILSNAVRYTQAGGQVIVSTSYELTGEVVMRVRDTGIGMSASEVEHALKPFKQINSLKRGRGDGTGLGLPLTKAMVEANRARFAIHSNPGEGTLVEITFPQTRVLAD